MEFRNPETAPTASVRPTTQHPRSPTMNARTHQTSTSSARRTSSRSNRPTSRAQTSNRLRPTSNRIPPISLRRRARSLKAREVFKASFPRVRVSPAPVSSIKLDTRKALARQVEALMLRLGSGVLRRRTVHKEETEAGELKVKGAGFIYYSILQPFNECKRPTHAEIIIRGDESNLPIVIYQLLV